MRPLARFLSLAATVSFTLSACADDPTAPVLPDGGEITVNASAGTAYLSLENEPRVVTPSDPSTSTAWDLAFTSTSVSLNGGQAGPNGTKGFCLCANATATNAQVQTFTAANQLAAFEAVGPADIPADAQFTADALNAAVTGWYSGTVGGTLTPVNTRTFILRYAGSSVTFAKFRVTGIQNSSAASAGQVTLEYAIQPEGSSQFGPTQTITLDGRTGAMALDFATAQMGASVSGWDVKLDGFALRTNGGVSATAGGNVGVLTDPSTPFADITVAYASSAPTIAYRNDTYSGVFAASPWYRYNITGTDNQIWPVFNVYLVKRGSKVWKVQIISYYSASAQPRHITVRYEQITQ